MSDHTAVEKPAVRLPLLAATWLWVVAPFAWGFISLVQRIPALFGT